MDHSSFATGSLAFESSWSSSSGEAQPLVKQRRSTNAKQPMMQAEHKGSNPYSPSVKGLGLILGVVGLFDSSNGVKVPHIGWNAVKITKDSQILDETEGRHVCFVHSYRAVPTEDNIEWISSTCNYGENFIASIRRGNALAVQFHPEKSGGMMRLCTKSVMKGIFICS